MDSRRRTVPCSDTEAVNVFFDDVSPTHTAFGRPDGVQPKAGTWLGGYDVVIS